MEFKVILFISLPTLKYMHGPKFCFLITASVQMQME